MRIFQVSCNLDVWCSHTFYYKMRTACIRKAQTTQIYPDVHYFFTVKLAKSEKCKQLQFLIGRRFPFHFFCRSQIISLTIVHNDQTLKMLPLRGVKPQIPVMTPKFTNSVLQLYEARYQHLAENNSTKVEFYT